MAVIVDSISHLTKSFANTVSIKFSKKGLISEFKLVSYCKVIGKLEVSGNAENFKKVILKTWEIIIFFPNEYT